MIVYINGIDNRCNELKRIMLEQGYQIQDNIRLVSKCDIVYLGKDGQGLENLNYKINCFVFTLLKNQRLEYLSQMKGFKYRYLYSDEQFIDENTYISDEALIGYMIINNTISLANAKILILGYGHCGKDLAGKLAKFKACITVSTRNEHYCDEIDKQEYKYINLNNLDLAEYDFIINTIPSQILTGKLLKTKKDNCKIYDISSYPYGMDLVERDKNYTQLDMLPTRYAYKSSAKILYKSIKRFLDNYA